MMKRFMLFVVCLIDKGGTAQNLPPAASFSPSSYTTCAGAVINFTDLSTNDPTSWIWAIPGASTANSFTSSPTFTFGSTGTYSVSLQVSNAFGSNTATSSIVVHPGPTVTAGSNQLIVCRYANNTFTASGADTYSWNTSQNGSVAVILISSSSITIWVAGTNIEGCTDTVIMKPKVYNCGHSLAENSADNLIASVYPNPSNGNFIVEKFDFGLCTFVFYDILGESLQTGEIEKREEIDISVQPKGIYFLTLRVGNVQSTRKIIKE
jgi:PKD repeat protein